MDFINLLAMFNASWKEDTLDATNHGCPLHLKNFSPITVLVPPNYTFADKVSTPLYIKSISNLSLEIEDCSITSSA